MSSQVHFERLFELGREKRGAKTSEKLARLKARAIDDALDELAVALRAEV